MQAGGYSHYSANRYYFFTKEVDKRDGKVIRRSLSATVEARVLLDAVH